MKIITMFFFLALSNSFACSVDNSSFNELIENPLKSKTFAIVRAELRFNERVVKNVDPFPKFNIVFGPGPCSGYGKREKKETMILLSREPLSDLNRKSGRRNSGEILLISLSDLDDEFHKKYSSLANEWPSGYPNIFWSICKSDSDCIRSKQSCGINKAFTENFISYITIQKTLKNGCTIVPNMKVTSSKCVENLCR